MRERMRLELTMNTALALRGGAAAEQERLRCTSI
jgi:hypothetical protein